MDGDTFYIVLMAYMAVNIVCCLAYGLDKLLAIKHTLRIPEKWLLMLALAGPVGALAGMLCFRHKTKHWKFLILVPLFMALHVAAVVWFNV